jgi:hypothetical protein
MGPEGHTMGFTSDTYPSERSHGGGRHIGGSDPKGVATPGDQIHQGGATPEDQIHQEGHTRK